MAHDLVQQKLIDLLNEPIRGEEARRVVQRAERLVALFSGLDGSKAATLHIRLNDQRDPLSRLFDCELSTAFRTHLRELLAVAQVAQPPPEEPPPEEPPPEEPPPEEPPPEEPPPEEPPPEEPPPEEPPPEEPPPEEPPPEEPPFVEPPPQHDSGPLVLDVLQYLENIRDWARRRSATATSDRLRDTLRRLEATATEGLRIAAMPVAAVAVAYFAYNALRRRLEMHLAFSALPTALERLPTYFERSQEYVDLDRALDTAEDLINEVEASDQVERQLREEQGSRVTVDPRVRGFAIEDFRLQELFQGGYERLPTGFPGIDGVRGNFRRDGLIRVYQNAEGLSIKSTEVTDPRRLISMFEREYLKPLVDKTYLAKRGHVQVVSLRSKTLMLAFEEGTIGRIGPETQAAVRAMAARCRSAGVTFRWFVFAEGSAHPGDEFLRQLRRGE